MQTSKNLMEQIEKIIKVVNPDMSIFVGDSWLVMILLTKHVNFINM